MNTKKFLVFFVMLFSILLISISVSANEIANPMIVEVNGIDANSMPAIVVGDILLVRVEFTSLINIQDVTVRAELEGDRKDSRAETSFFDVEAGKRYAKVLRVEVPFDLRDKLSGFANLNIKIRGSDFSSNYISEENFQLRVQRDSYSLDLLSLSVPQIVNSGDVFPVDFVIKNTGYNDLKDLFVIARISSLGIERKIYIGDALAIRCDASLDSFNNYNVDITRKCFENGKDTLSGRIFLEMPYNAKSGIYAIELKAFGEDISMNKVSQVVVENKFNQGNFIVSGEKLLIANPTDSLVVYRLIPQSTEDVRVYVEESLVSIPAGSTKLIRVDAESDLEGTYTYSVNVFSSDGSFVGSVDFTKTFEGKRIASPIIVLTIILAVIFIVLLVVLIVLLGKKPEKTEEFSESYY